MNLMELYDFAEQQNIEIDWFSLGLAESLSLPVEGTNGAIAIDPYHLRSQADEICKILHEFGHCMTLSYYNEHAAINIRQKAENTADKWAIRHQIPEQDLQAAVANGHTELWELAEYFGVTEDFMKKAICLYKHGNLAVDQYIQA